jgi:hypothetical protein
VFGETAAEGVTWAADMMHSFQHSGCETTWQKLVTWRAGLRGRRKRKAADRLLN